MAYLKQQRPEKVTVPAVRASKERKERLVCLTAYDYPTARVVDEAGTDIILVGDSVGNVVLGYDTTVPVTLEEMLRHTRAVRRGTERALLVADMPYGTYHTGTDDAVRAALRLVKEGGAEAVKLEGGRNRVEVIRRLVAEEIPVMGHIGLTPQSLNKLGSYRLQAKTADAARALVEDALMLQEAGVFAVVLEVVPREIAREVTAALDVPTVGIGAGPDCDAQILVTHDMLGLSFSKTSPRFVRQYADLRAAMGEAIQAYADDVRAGAFPSDQESYPLPADAATELGLARDAADKESIKP
jgi:3-methyl-2-oxobutanoate hydroxymethyltransferase